MRPVNLIPPEDRRDANAPLRAGPLGYVVIAVLALAVVAVALVVMTDNKISEEEAAKASLESQLAQAEQEAARLSPFAEFAALQQVRQETVTGLATTRFDWERVLRELAIVIPEDVWLTNLDAKASADAASDSTSSTAAGAESILGPSLDIEGCASGHVAVAQFLSALRDIDGVTRATVVRSDRPVAAEAGESDSTGGEGGISCASRDFISTFQVLVAFDAVQPAVSSSGAVPTAPTATTAAATADEAGAADAQSQLEEQKDSAAEATQQGEDAVNTFVPGTGGSP